MAFIYKIVNDINNKIYVGKTLETIEKRFKEHIDDSKRGRDANRPLYRAMNKYGIEHFWVEQLEECSYEIVNERETYWIKKLDSFSNGYNATLGGDGKVTANYQLIYNLWLSGLNVKEIQEKTNYDPQTIKRGLVENKITHEDIINRLKQQKSRKVCMIDMNTNEIIQCFGSGKEAGIFLGDKNKAKHIGKVCRGERQSAYGYYWKFLDD